MKLLQFIFLSVFFIFSGKLQAETITDSLDFIRADTSLPKDLKQYVDALTSIINKRHPHSKYHYVIHTANFTDGQSVPAVQADEENTKHVLWVGSVENFHLHNIAGYDIVLASTPLMQKFFTEQGINAFYLPMFGLKQQISQNKYKYFAVIGNSALVEDAFIKRKIFYRKYKNDAWDEIRRDMPKFKAVFINNSNYAGKSLDVAPVYLDMAIADIPMAVQYDNTFLKMPAPITLLNDDISYYQTETDLDFIIDDFLAPSDNLLYKIRRAHNIVSKYFSVQAIADKLDYILTHQSAPSQKTFSLGINFDIPVSVGHTSAGDYWLVYDLIDYFTHYNIETSVSFFNSKFIPPMEVNIIVAGFLPKTYQILRPFTGKYNIVYVAYGQFPQHSSDDLLSQEEDITDFHTYLEQLEKLYSDEDVSALVLASKRLTEALNAKNVNAYYVPQFTNPKRFYPDYDENVKSEVFFVGVNSFYRKAVPAVLKAGLPITIYGPNWNGLAKADYIDNRVLRKYYSSAKIVLNDTREGMKRYGFISNRIFDASACGTLVISDYMPEIEEIYGDSVPMWKTEEELIELVKYYLNLEHEAERKEKAERARQITLQNFTSEIAAQKFMKIIADIKKEKSIP